MNPNIITEEGLAFLNLALDVLIFKVRLSYPIKVIISEVQILLRFNIFQFVGTHYRKKVGGAMGSPLTCLWAILTFLQWRF